MSDLVKRLRLMAEMGWNPIGDEAADEIDRLREVLVDIHNVDDSEWVNNRIDDALNHKEG